MPYGQNIHKFSDWPVTGFMRRISRYVLSWLFLQPSEFLRMQSCQSTERACLMCWIDFFNRVRVLGCLLETDSAICATWLLGRVEPATVGVADLESFLFIVACKELHIVLSFFNPALRYVRPTCTSHRSCWKLSVYLSVLFQDYRNAELGYSR